MAAQGELKHIKDLKFWGPADVLMSKYSFDPEVARLIESFILPCLNVNPSTWEWARTTSVCYNAPSGKGVCGGDERTCDMTIND